MPIVMVGHKLSQCKRTILEKAMAAAFFEQTTGVLPFHEEEKATTAA
jgi:hypothetical protein